MINNSRLADEFARLAAISSPSFRESEISAYLTRRFTELGCRVVADGAGARTGSQSDNLVAYWPASGKEAEPIMLSVHMDTVEPAENVVPVLRDGVFFSAGDTVLGSDDKSGIAEIIEAMEVVREQNIPHGPVEIVITVCEEVGLVGAKNFDASLLQSKRGIALDTAGVNILIHRAPCANKLRMEIIGQESHAGIAPEKGLSAILVATRALEKMRLGRIDDETTANIGTIHGGQATNIVPRKVVLEGEARSHDPAKLEQQTQHMLDCLKTAAEELAVDINGRPFQAQVTTEVMADYPVMAVAVDSPWIQSIADAHHRLGRELVIKGSGGGSDANIFNGYGIETVILATGMSNVHSCEEHIAVADMTMVSEALVEIIRGA